VQFARKRVKYRRFEARIELLDGEKVIDTIELVAGRGQEHSTRPPTYPAHSRPKRTSHPLQAKFEALSALSEGNTLRGSARAVPDISGKQMEQIVDLANMYSESELGSRHGAWHYL